MRVYTAWASRMVEAELETAYSPTKGADGHALWKKAHDQKIWHSVRRKTI